MNNIIGKAIAKATKLHAGQVRKGDGETPYIVHPIEVGIVVSEYSSIRELIVAGILHDTVEDCDYTIEEVEADFGAEVARLVSALTEDKSIEDWLERKTENLERLRTSQGAYSVKAIDVFTNMRSLLDALVSEGAVVWQRFKMPKEMMLAYYRLVLKDTEEFLPRKLIAEYVDVLKDLEYSEVLEKKQALGFALQ